MDADLISDIHLEFAPLELPGGADLLIVAGDIGEARSFFRNDSNFWRKKSAEMRHFIETQFAKYGDVVYVPGNHEYYHWSLSAADAALYNLTPALTNGGIHYFGDIAVIGTTLWADANKGDPATINHLVNCMNDFSVIDTDRGPFFPTIMREVHQQQLAKLQSQIDAHADYKVVVVTHHAPSELSVVEKYKHDFLMNGGFRTELSDFILERPQIKLWCHGHMHDPSDYMIGSTRVVCHPRGYMGHGGVADYKPLRIKLPE